MDRANALSGGHEKHWVRTQLGATVTTYIQLLQLK